MKATNISTKVLHLESGDVFPGCDGEFTGKEYESLLRQGMVSTILGEEALEEPEVLTTAPTVTESDPVTEEVEVPVVTAKPVKKPSRKKKAAEQPAGFL